MASSPTLQLAPPQVGLNVVDSVSPNTIAMLKKLEEGVYREILVTYNGIMEEIYCKQAALVMRYRKSNANYMSSETTVRHSKNFFDQPLACDTFLNADKNKIYNTAPIFAFDISETEVPETSTALLEDNNVTLHSYGDVSSKYKFGSPKECALMPILNEWVRVSPNTSQLAVVFGLMKLDYLHVISVPAIDYSCVLEGDTKLLPRGLPVFDKYGKQITGCVGTRLTGNGRFPLNCSTVDWAFYKYVVYKDATVTFFHQRVNPIHAHRAVLVADKVQYDKRKKAVRNEMKASLQAISHIPSSDVPKAHININFAQFGSSVVINVTHPIMKEDKTARNPISRQEIEKIILSRENAHYTLAWKPYTTRYGSKYKFVEIVETYKI